MQYIEDKEIDKMLDYIEAVANSLDNEKAEDKVRKLHQYLTSNKAGLIPLKNRDLRLPKLNENLEYRTMGNCEHNVYLSVAKRLKHRCAAWSPEGSINLSKILCLKISHKLSEKLAEIAAVLPEKFT